MKAKDLMVPLFESLTPDMTLKDASLLLRNARRDSERTGVKGLPVLDSEGLMIGFLSMGDILKAVFPRYMNLMNLGEFTWDGMVESLAAKTAGKTVAEMMTTEIVTVEAEAPLMECVDHMLKNNVKRLPVLDRKGKVIGILYERDVFLEIVRIMHGEKSSGA